MDDKIRAKIRAALLADPQAVLDDREMMHALIGAHEAEQGNVIDIRGRAMEALEVRLDRVEGQHERVVAAAFENQSGVAMIHRAVLALVSAKGIAELATALENDAREALRLTSLKVVIERADTAPDLGPVFIWAAPGTVAEAMRAGSRATRGQDIVLRPASATTASLHGRIVSSEALLPLDLGPSHGPAMLLMGAREVGRFTPSQATDLLRFFGETLRVTLINRLVDV